MLRNWRGWLLLLVLLLAAAVGRAGDGPPSAWEDLLAAIAPLEDAGERATAISARFLGTAYRADTLGGGPGLPEELVVSLDAVDCFTLLDYVEALRRSSTPGEFRQRLAEVRYRNGMLAWEQRRHFFTDWSTARDGRVVDVTAEIGGHRTKQSVKLLNRRADGGLFLPGVAVQERTVRFLPVAALGRDVLERLRPGDYLGIYTAEPGLDVTHVGIVVRRDARLYLRHASSPTAAGQVIDSDLVSYLSGKPGVVILRPR